MNRINLITIAMTLFVYVGVAFCGFFTGSIFSLVLNLVGIPIYPLWLVPAIFSGAAVLLAAFVLWVKG